MKTHTKQINGITVTAHNDSNADWCVKCNGRTEYFRINEWTMKKAMEFWVELVGEMEPAE